MKKAAGGNKKRKRQVSSEDSNEENVEDVELQAEIEALKLSRAEKGLLLEPESVITEKQPVPSTSNIYNAAALLKCVEDMGTVNLPFLETLQISEFSLEIVDENDDLEREVRKMPRINKVIIAKCILKSILIDDVLQSLLGGSFGWKK